MGEGVDYEKYRITDSDLTKWGKFIGTHPLPIVPTTQLTKFKTICISALSFYPQIARSLPSDKKILSIGGI